MRRQVADSRNFPRTICHLCRRKQSASAVAKSGNKVTGIENHIAIPMDTPATPHATLIQARDIAIEMGLNYVYVGNVLDPQRESTYCPNCKKLLIERRWYDIGIYELDQNRCGFCGSTVAGHFGEKPGHWGTRREPVDPAALLRALGTDR